MDYFLQKGYWYPTIENGESSAVDYMQTRQHRGTEAVGARVQMVSQVHLLQLQQQIGEVELCLPGRVGAIATGQRGDQFCMQVQILPTRELRDDNRGFN